MSSSQPMARRARRARGLSPKQRRFVEEYLVDLNATQAAIRAGYSGKRADAQGWENLRKPEIAQAIAQAQAARSARTAITADRVLFELARLAFVDVRRFYDTNGCLKKLSDLDDDTASALASVETREISGDSGVVGLTIKVRPWNKPAALKMLGEHFQLFSAPVSEGDEAFLETLVGLILRHVRGREARHEILATVEAQLARTLPAALAATPRG